MLVPEVSLEKLGKAWDPVFLGGVGKGSGGICIQTSMMSPKVGLGRHGTVAIACLHAGMVLLCRTGIRASFLASGFGICFSRAICSRSTN